MARKILLADDSVTAQNMGRKILADAGYEVITVNNGSAALKKIAETKPDLIVLDVYMPGYSGLEVCQRLKEAGETARIPVLLTVGKLEPFKPEEAKRVRAEGFIVKPFEASELLSALTKLEDKIVPRSESSKPGRFARTIAAVEEGRYDKTMTADANEDSGWKNRISFPSKKKAKTAEPEDNDDSAIYNQVNKDLRTVVEPKPAPVHETSAAAAKASAKIEEPRVDLGALAPEGLPKDVTAEEIAALAAAAAQMQGKIQTHTNTAEATADSKVVDAKVVDAKIVDAKIVDSKTVDAKTVDAKIEEVKASEPVPAQASAQEPAQESTQALAQESGKPEERTAAIEPAAAATFAEQKLEEEKKPAGEEETKTQAFAEAASGPLPGSGVTAALAVLEAQSGPGSSSSVDDASPDRNRKAEPEPVTMAVAAGQSSAASRWTAVAVAVAPEESGIVLEHEMRKTYAAYAAYEEATSRPVQEIPSVSEAQPLVVAAVPAEIALPVESPQPAAGTTTAETSEAAPSASIAAITADEFSVRVKSFEMVGASSEAKPDETKRDEFKSEVAKLDEVMAAAADAASVPLAETAAFAPTLQPVAAPEIEARTSEIASAQETEPQTAHEAVAPVASEPARYEEPAAPKADLDHIGSVQDLPATEGPVTHQPTHIEAAHEEPVHDERVHQEPAKYEDLAPAASAAPTSPTSAPTAEDMPAICKEEVESLAVSHIAEHEAPAASAEAVVSSEQAAPVKLDTSNHDRSNQDGSSEDRSSHDRSSHDGSHQHGSGKEPDIAATTAAAWASWRRIRESGNAKDATEPGKPEDSSTSRDEAAMAVAAGAETAPEEGTEIASIVDSVLADLRPKIMEEISKKFKKK